jgi:DNA-binding protein YbaB
MQEGLRKLYTGQFNTMTQEHLADGTVTITLSSHGENKVYRFRVKNLYQEDEELLEDEVLTVATPAHIKKRMKEAMKDAEKETGETEYQPG